MAYTKTNWVNGVTPINQENLNKIENQLEANTNDIDNLNDYVNGEKAMGDIVVGSIEGKNLFDKNNANIINNAGFTLGSPTITANTGDAIIYISCNENTTYTVSKRASSSSRSIGYTSSIPAVGSTVSGVVNIPANGTNATITTETGAKYLVIRIYNEGQDSSVTLQQMLATVQIEKGSSATEYDEYMKYGYNSEESMGNIVVDDVSCKNLLDTSILVNGDYGTAQTNRVATRQSLYLDAGTYTISTNLDLSTYRYYINTLGGTPPNYTQKYNSNWVTTSSFTFTLNATQAGYFVLVIAKVNNGDLTPSDVSSFNYQLEKGSEATNYTPYKSFDATAYVLWTNSSSTSNFASQTITLSDSINNYKYYEVIYKRKTDSDIYISSGRVATNQRHLALNPYGYIYFRGISSISGTSLGFYDCFYNATYGNTAETASNNILIPYQVIAYK